MAPSMIAMKYQRQPYVGRPLQPGERYSVARDMETCIRYSTVQYSTILHSTIQYSTFSMLTKPIARRRYGGSRCAPS